MNCNRIDDLFKLQNNILEEISQIFKPDSSIEVNDLKLKRLLDLSKQLLDINEIVYSIIDKTNFNLIFNDNELNKEYDSLKDELELEELEELEREIDRELKVR